MPKLKSITYPDIPVSKHREEVIGALKNHQVVVVVGDTGSGKTTQLPKMALEYVQEITENIAANPPSQAPQKQATLVGCTQPRRIAAASVSKRVSEELQVTLGQEVGYQVRFEDKSSEETRIKFMTDGILLAETQGDPLLKKYAVLIIDEAHERSLNIDFLLGYLNNLLEKRSDIRIIISSATLDAGAFSEFFTTAGKPAPIIEAEGRTFPVETHYFPNDEERELSQHVTSACEWVRQFDADGDILIFLPGEREIRECTEHLEGQRWARTEILPLFARMGLGDQQKVFRTLQGTRRIVLATNVAETSLTIPGIVYVIDSGIARMSRWNPSRQVQRLQIEKISQASARQRKGRCGRVREGVCLRLYSEEDHDERTEYTDPEIKRSSLGGVILRMKSLKLPDISEFPFIDPPSDKLVSEGYRTLREIGALTDDHHMCKTGHQIARIPVDPRLGKMLLESSFRNCLPEMLVIASGLSIMDPKERPQDKQQQADQAHAAWKHADSDFISLLLLWHGLNQHREGRNWKRNQLRKFCKKHFLNFRRVMEWDNLHNELRQISKQALQVKSSDLTNLADSITDWAHDDEIHKSILAGIPRQVGLYDTEKRAYKGAQAREFSIFPGSGLFNRKKKPVWLLAFELVDTTRLWSRRNAIMKPEWVEEIAPHLCRSRYHSAYWNKQQGAVYAKEIVTSGSLTIIDNRSVHFGAISPERSKEVFIREALLADGLKSKPPILKQLAALREEVKSLEHKLRRPDGIWAEELVYLWFHEHLPSHICTAKSFLQWCKKEEKNHQLTISDVIYEQAKDLTTDAYPDSITLADEIYSLYYKTAPGEPDDGLTVGIHIDQLAIFPELFLAYGVLGDLEERVFLLIRSLPKSQRIACNPARERAQAFISSVNHNLYTQPLLEDLAAFLTKQTGVFIEASQFDPSRLPAELMTKIWVCDDQGEELAFGSDLAEIKSRLAGLMTSRFEQASNQEWEISGMKRWDEDTLLELPLNIDMPTGTAFPALRDEGATVGVHVFADELEAKHSHRKGCVRFFLLEHQDQAKYVLKNLPISMEAKMYLPIMGDTGIDLTTLLHWSVEWALCSGHTNQNLPRQAADSSRIFATARGELHESAKKICTTLENIISDYREIDTTLSEWKKDKHLSEVAEDIDEQMRWLLRKNFTDSVDVQTLCDYERWFAGMLDRMKRASSNPLIKDLEKMDSILDLWEAWYGDWIEHPNRPKLIAVGYTMMNLRTMTFSPQIPLRSKISLKIATKHAQDAGLNV